MTANVLRRTALEPREDSRLRQDIPENKARVVRADFYDASDYPEDLLDVRAAIIQADHLNETRKGCRDDWYFVYNHEGKTIRTPEDVGT